MSVSAQDDPSCQGARVAVCAALVIPVAMVVIGDAVQSACLAAGYQYYWDADYVSPSGGGPGYARCTAAMPGPDDYVYP